MADFQKVVDNLAALNTEVVALSVDSEDEARKTKERHQITFPILYGLDAHEFAASTGAYINEDPSYIHATGFILRPSGTLALVVYSSGAIGRLTASDTVGFIQYYQKHNY